MLFQKMCNIEEITNFHSNDYWDAGRAQTAFRHPVQFTGVCKKREKEKWKQEAAHNVSSTTAKASCNMKTLTMMLSTFFSSQQVTSDAARVS